MMVLTFFLFKPGQSFAIGCLWSLFGAFMISVFPQFAAEMMERCNGFSASDIGAILFLVMNTAMSLEHSV